MTQNIYPLGDYNTTQILELMEAVREAKSLEENEGFDEKTLLYRRPDAAPNAGEFVKTIPIEETPFIVPDAFSGKVGILLASNLTMEQLEMIGAFGDIYLKEAIKVNLGIANEDDPKDINIKMRKEYVDHSPAWQL